MHTRWRKLPAVAGAVLAVTIALAGCSSSSDSGASSAEGGAPMPLAPQQGTAGKSDQANGKQVPMPQAGGNDRKLARSAKLELTATKVRETAAKARGVALGAGGYVGQESTEEESATLSLAVPAEKLDGVVDQLAHTGTSLVKQELSSQDVTSQVIDVEARLSTQRASVERIRALLGRATSVSEIASVESELTSREATLESLEQQHNSLAGSVAMATIAVTITSVSAPPPPGAPDRSGFFGGLAGGWDAFLVFGTGLLTVLGAIAPFMIIIAPLGYLGWRLYRRRRPVPRREPAPAVNQP